MLIQVQYQDESYGSVDTRLLDNLLLGKSLKQFYRPSEERWVHVYRDRIRGLGGDYSGQDRRHLTAGTMHR